ncbi:unnamed protein product [Rhodiola kirilowii]
MSMKLDMSKAYDRIEWHFLERMMAAMGFAEEWIKRIMLCVSTVSYRVKINDNISDIIKPTRGLRQGDPISPYLFLICAEWLTFALSRYQEIGLLKGIKICRGAPTISNLMFADDYLLFIKNTKDSLSWIRNILKRYEAVSGQKVNLAKSEVVCSRSVPAITRQELVDRMGMKIVDGHSSYLGFPHCFSHKKTIVLRNIEEKITRKIGDWKHKLLSSAGKEVLIKSVLQAILNYAMACFKIPLTLCRKMAGEVFRFWWSNNKSKGIHWIRADELFKEKIDGGMGFRNMELMNIAMLAKQGWRILTEPELLVSKIFKAKYFPESDVLSAGLGSRPSYAWRGILEAVDIIKYGAEWDSREGRHRWIRDSSGRFSVKGAYQCAKEMERIRNPPEGEQSDVREVQRFWRSFWRLRISNKIKNFSWRLYHDSLPSLLNLEKRGIVVFNRCCLCGTRGESSIHLFKECRWTKEFLNQINLPPPVWDNQCKEPGYWLWLCAKVCSEEEFKSLLCGLWLAWKNRNEIIYGKGGRKMEELRIKLQFLLEEIKGARRRMEPELGLSGEINDRAWFLCDGAFDSTTGVGGWGVVYSLNGIVEVVQAGWMDGISSSFEAECKAIKEGCHLAEQLGIDKACIASDSLEALWDLSLGSWRPGGRLQEIKECFGFLERHPRWTLVHIARERNIMADWLARKARRYMWGWNSRLAIPKDLLKLL